MKGAAIAVGGQKAEAECLMWGGRGREGGRLREYPADGRDSDRLGKLVKWLEEEVGITLLIGSIFVMAKIRWIGHDYQAPFWGVILSYLNFVVGNQAVTQGKNKLPHD